ncbi:type II secretion system F family protein [Mycolicibacterium sp. 120266]|uniref:type II secretion system F family protein n=1 Tax=Mycolicibacterium sp. 120266 TaxID=3090601 RepID=UPI00299D73E9|nr:type II secretion system F family protein [Mycolicibacterium sp. 120266]MDX1871274.1 type II secretion system F family protein [Mycolicibacterium sp. 120266]
MITAVLLLAAALTVAPPAARLRLGLPGGHLRRVRRISPWWGAGPVAMVAIVLLPAGTAIAAGVLVGTVLVRRSRSKRRARARSEAAALRDALDVLVGELRVGAHPVTAFEVAAAEVDGAVADALHGVAARGRLGADVAAGLRAAGRRAAEPAHWERLAVCWQLAHVHGLAIATLMRAAQRDIVERERFAVKVEAGMAGARTTATILAGMPVLGIALGQLIGADSLRFLLSGGTGGWLLGVGVTLCCLGLWWSDRISSGVLR